MKKNIVIALSALFIFAFSVSAFAGSVPDSKPKYASVNIYFRGMAPAKVFTIVDGNVESVKCESGFTDQDAGELAVLGPCKLPSQNWAKAAINCSQQLRWLHRWLFTLW